MIGKLGEKAISINTVEAMKTQVTQHPILSISMAWVNKTTFP